MDFTIIFKALYKPIIFVFKEIGTMFLKIEAWWISKKETTKLNIRWFAFVLLLLILAVSREIQVKNDVILAINRSNSDSVLLQKKIDFLEYRYLTKLEGDIKELKEIKTIAVSNQEQLNEMNE